VLFAGIGGGFGMLLANAVIRMVRVLPCLSFGLVGAQSVFDAIGDGWSQPGKALRLVEARSLDFLN
jgi:hypothetical protein